MVHHALPQFFSSTALFPNDPQMLLPHVFQNLPLKWPIGTECTGTPDMDKFFVFLKIPDYEFCYKPTTCLCEGNRYRYRITYPNPPNKPPTPNRQIYQGSRSTSTLEGLINIALQHNYSLFITAHYTEGEPGENITLHYNTTTSLL